MALAVSSGGGLRSVGGSCSGFLTLISSLLWFLVCCLICLRCRPLVSPGRVRLLLVLLRCPVWWRLRFRLQFQSSWVVSGALTRPLGPLAPPLRCFQQRLFRGLVVGLLRRGHRRWSGRWLRRVVVWWCFLLGLVRRGFSLRGGLVAGVPGRGARRLWLWGWGVRFWFVLRFQFLGLRLRCRRGVGLWRRGFRLSVGWAPGVVQGSLF